MFLQQQLVEARNALQAFREQQAHEEELRGLKLKEQDIRTRRLENIIAACVENMSKSGGIPPFLRDMIELDAPGALTSFRGNQMNPVEFLSRPSTTNVGASNAIPQASTAICRKPVAGFNREIPATVAAVDGVLEVPIEPYPWYQVQDLAAFVNEDQMAEDQDMFWNAQRPQEMYHT